MGKIFSILLVILFITGCKDDQLPKPEAFLSLEYPEPVYSSADLNCPYDFEMNQIARISNSKGNVPCWINIDYPLLDATIFITYQEINNNLDSLLMDAQKLPLQHTIKADFIEGDVYENPANKTYGMFYEVDGDAASQAQFYLTDSVNHFLTGSLYFNQAPNFDSIMPAAAYMKKDMKHLVETLKWKGQ